MTSKILQNLIQLAPQVSLYPAGLKPLEISPNEIALPQLPSSAFGDGTHPTTRLCAGAVDFVCRLHKPHSVLDVGTGTGVLARIARERGSQFVVGTDIDPDALVAARSNSSLDSHTREIQVLNAPPHTWGQRFNLVVANILEDPLRELAKSLSEALAPEGILLISGFTRLQVPRLLIAFSGCGLTVLNESFLEEWALLMLKKTSYSVVENF
jgi:ribosomal protein L11 methyltransferase